MSFIDSNASQGPFDFTLQNVWLWVNDHTIVITHSWGHLASLVAQLVKNLPAMQETWV